RDLEGGVRALSEQFLELAGGNFSARVARSFRGDPLDVLAYLFNQTAVEIGDMVLQRERQHTVLEAILESMLDGVLLCDGAGVVQRPNSAISQLLGYEVTQLTGKHIGALLAESEAELAAALVERVAQGPFRDRDTLFRTASGELISMAVNASACRD